MKAAPFLVAALALLAAPACHPDACVWDVERVRSESVIAVTRDGTPLALGPNTSVGASSGYSERTGAVTTELSFGVTIDGDPGVDRVVFSLAPVRLVAPATIPLADLDANLRLVRDGTVLDDAPVQTGVLTLPNLATRCEYSDAYIDTGAYWICATDVDATVDIPFSVGGADYRVIANVSQRETMDETCHECTGIEGCDY